MDNEFLLMDRIQKIKQIIEQYGEENFYLSFSGGKDSTVLHYLLDMAIPENSIPRVYVNTGIEYNKIIEFVKGMAERDNRIVIIKPTVPIKPMLEKEGYPFKSKEHSHALSNYQRFGIDTKTVQRYLFPKENRKTFGCPDKLKYQFTEDFNIHISAKCCDRLKKDVLHKWEESAGRSYAIVGITKIEGGWRKIAHCLAFKHNTTTLLKFQPLIAVTKEWEEWFIDKFQIKLCGLYYEPYNFDRTGCKGCPFNPRLQKDLDTLEKFFPNERKQCEIIWKPVYDEYRRLGYRLKAIEENHQYTIDEFLKEG